MKPLKVAMAALDLEAMPAGVPDWVSRDLVEKGMEFDYKECETGEELRAHAGDADIVWLFKGSPILSAENLPLLSRCGAILRTGSGTDNVAVAEATRLGIVVANTPDATTDPVSDHTIGLMLAVARRIPAHDRALRKGRLELRSMSDYCHLSGKTVGLLGFGRIAQRLAEKLRVFQVTTLGYDPYLNSDFMTTRNVTPTPLDDLLRQSDFVSVHCPLTQDTHHLIGERELRLMKPTAILINTSRGAVIDEPALARALQEGWIAQAGLDVLDQEPPDPDNPLLKLDDVVMTPHMAAYSTQFTDAAWRLSVETIFDLAEGRWPRSCVNPDVKPRFKLS